MAKFTNEKKLKEIARRYEGKKIDELLYFLTSHQSILKRLTFGNIERMISNNLHFSPRLYELNYIEKLGLSNKEISDVFKLRAKFINDSGFYDDFLDFYYSLKDTKAAILKMAEALKIHSTLPSGISLYSLIKVGSICSSDELSLIVLGLNKYSNGDDFYQAFNSHIERTTVSAATSVHLLESYIEDCYNISNEELLVPDRYLGYYLHH